MSGEKRSQDVEDTLLSETAIIVDIEGTTTSISFVKVTKSMAVAPTSRPARSHFIDIRTSGFVIERSS